MKSEMEKLRRETEELRGQVRRLKAESAHKDAATPPAAPQAPAPQERPHRPAIDGASGPNPTPGTSDRPMLRRMHEQPQPPVEQPR